MNKVFVDFHVIQSVPPSCLNRDDTGSPKTAVYGGVRRARVSSQSWKRAIRMMFKEYFGEKDLGIRTKRLVDLIAGEIHVRDGNISEEEARKRAQKILKTAVVIKGDSEDTDALFFIGRQQAVNLAELALQGDTDKKTAQATLNKDNTVDIALFGRMVANDPALNAEASAQVAHAISTHRVETEYDYFTAVDDNPDPEVDHAGASMIGTIEFTSATLYRYATVAAHDLFEEMLRDETALTVAIREFARAFIMAIPDGKQNTFAAHTPPDAVLVALRTDRPLNLVGAFEAPIPARGVGFAGLSAAALEKHAQQVYGNFCGEPGKSFVVGEYLGELGTRLSLPELLESIGAETVALCGGGQG